MRFFRCGAGSAGGFTLAELLVSLAILGVIAAFTIPKVLQAQQNNKWNAAAKEAISALSQSFLLHCQNAGCDENTTMGSFFQHLNYIKVDTASQIDSHPGQASRSCTATFRCYTLASGAVVAFAPAQRFGATDDLAAIYFYLDPDGKYSGSVTGNGKSVVLFLYFNGRLTSMENVLFGTHDEWGGTYSPNPGTDPDWFSW